MNLSDCPNIDYWIRNSCIFLFPQCLVCKQKFEFLNLFTIKTRILLLMFKGDCQILLCRFWPQKGSPPPFADKICAGKLVVSWGIPLQPPPLSRPNPQIHTYFWVWDWLPPKRQIMVILPGFRSVSQKSERIFICQFVTRRRRLNEFYQDPISPSFLFSIVTPWISFSKLTNQNFKTSSDITESRCYEKSLVNVVVPVSMKVMSFKSRIEVQLKTNVLRSLRIRY